MLVGKKEKKERNQLQGGWVKHALVQRREKKRSITKTTEGVKSRKCGPPRQPLGGTELNRLQRRRGEKKQHTRV